MNDDEIRAAIEDAMGAVAPEADLTLIDPAARLQDELDLDSMDFLSFVVGLHERLGIEIPERDYPKLATLDGCVAHLRMLTVR